MTTPQPGELLAASVVQALLDIREEFFKLNKTLERLVNSLEKESVKEINIRSKDFFKNRGNIT